MPHVAQEAEKGQHSESFQSLAFNGAWSYFTNSPAIHFEGQKNCTYAAWIDNSGNITLGAYDHSKGEITTQVIKKKVAINDSNNPCLLVDAQGQLIVFYHAQGQLCCLRSTEAENITQWGAEIELANYPLAAPAAPESLSYPSIAAIDLQASGKGLLVLWTTAQGEAKLSQSLDGGASWTAAKNILEGQVASLKAYSKNGTNIHLTVTSPEGSAYYKNIAPEQLLQEQTAAKLQELTQLGTGQAIVWDIAEDAAGNAIIAYSTSKDASTHQYHYAQWDGNAWQQQMVVESGGTYLKALKKTGIENPYLAAGMAIAPESPQDLYLSIKREGVFEIEKWSLNDSTQDWQVTSITSGSEKDNVHPRCVQGAPAGKPLQLMWMTNTNYYSNQYPTASKLHWADRYQTAIKMDLPSPAITNYFDPEQIKDLMRQTADWQFANPYDLRRLTDWHWGTYFVGLEELYQLTGEDRYKQEMINIGDGAKWRTNDQILYVDMITIISNWAWLYEREQDPKMIEQSQWALDVHLRTRRKSRADVRFANNPYFDEWWTWCDALFVAPPAFAAMYHATGEQKYVDYMDQMYWLTYDYLYSEEDQLVYRDDRYFTQRSENGKKIFWGRGNGWVIAGLCRIMNMIPADYPSRKKYEQAFKNLSHKLLEIQSADGGWRVSLLDPEYQDEAEMSGSAFIVYALAWGLNRGLLEEKYRPQIEKGWETMCKNVNKNGRFGNVQSEGIDPRNFTEEDWQVYGTGAYLMAAAEIYRMVGGK